MNKMFGYEIKVGLPPTLANEDLKRLVTDGILKKYRRE
jgi:DNA-binding Lrp family transcriptional regulator